MKRINYIFILFLLSSTFSYAQTEVLDCVETHPSLVVDGIPKLIKENGFSNPYCDLRIGKDGPIVIIAYYNTQDQYGKDYFEKEKEKMNSWLEDFAPEDGWKVGDGYRYEILHNNPEVSTGAYVYYKYEVGNCIISGQGTKIGEEFNRENLQSFVDDTTKVVKKITQNRKVIKYCNEDAYSNLPEVQMTKKEKEQEICEVTNVEGWMSPTQGFWQDDYSFEDKPGKQLTKTKTNSYIAELPMVKGRDTLLFGIRGASNFENDNKRKTIKLKATTTGTKEVPTKIIIKLKESEQEKIIYEAQSLPIPLEGPCGERKEFEFNLAAHNGIPHDKTFKFNEVGPYILTAELVREDNNKPTGIKVEVKGETVETFAPKIHLIPIILDNTTAYDLDGKNDYSLDVLIRNIPKLAEEAKLYIPDYYPLEPNSIEVQIHELQDLTHLVQEAEAGTWFKSMRWDSTLGTFREDAILAALTDYYTTQGILGEADRIVGVMRRDDLKLITPVKGLASSEKVVYVGEYDHGNLAHEIAHTLPFIWSTKQMNKECGIQYHLGGADPRLPISHGFRILLGGEENRKVVDRVESFLMTAYFGFYSKLNPDFVLGWPTQCTYWNLINQLQIPPDPELILVRGVIADDNKNVRGILLPTYQLNGIAYLPKGEDGKWSIILKNKENNEIVKYPFDPLWELADGKRNMVSFAYRIENNPSISKIELHGPNNLLDSIEISDNVPTVRITEHAIRDDNVEISWNAKDEDNNKLLYTIFYSPDDGKTWKTHKFEQKETSTILRYDTSIAQHKVKVIVNDGSQSNEDIYQFTTEQTEAQEEFSEYPEESTKYVPHIIITFILGAIFIWFIKFRNKK
jgi:hypothetical protein